MRASLRATSEAWRDPQIGVTLDQTVAQGLSSGMFFPILDGLLQTGRCARRVRRLRPRSMTRRSGRRGALLDVGSLAWSGSNDAAFGGAVARAATTVDGRCAPR